MHVRDAVAFNSTPGAVGALVESPRLGLGTLLARNTIINLAGQGLVGVIGVASVPTILGSLGHARFGLLAIVWVFLAYFTILDLGVGQATIKSVAEVLASGRLDRLPSFVWSSFATHAMCGMGAGVVLAAIAPTLSEHVFRVPQPIIPEVRPAFLIVGAMVPVILVGAAFRCVLEGAQRYDLVNLVRVPLAACWYVLPAAGGFLGWRLDRILLAVGTANVGGAVAYLLLAFNLFPVLRRLRAPESATVTLLVRYGGWMALTQAVWSFILQIDCLMIGSLLGVATLAFYEPPAELAHGLGIIPRSFIVLFPAFSILGRSRDADLREVSVKAFKFLLLSVGPAVLILVAFAGDVLGLWLGQVFRERSVLVLQVLAIGALLNSLGTIPDLFLKALGRPDAVAKIHLVLLLPYAGAGFLLIGSAGITGAAIAWTLRSIVETGALFGAALNHTPAFRCVLSDRRLWTAAAMIGGLGLGLLLVSAGTGWVPLVVSAALVVAFAVVSWGYVLDAADREQVRMVIRGSR